MRETIEIQYAHLCVCVCVQDKVRQLKEEVRVQYHKMHQLLEDDLGRTLEVLDKAHSKYCQENSTQTLQLNERCQEAKKLLSSVQVVFDKAEDINIMKVRLILTFTLHRFICSSFTVCDIPQSCVCGLEAAGEKCSLMKCLKVNEFINVIFD